MTDRICFYRNNGTTTELRRFGHEVIRNNGTTQHLVWFGPVFAIVRNRASVASIRRHRAA